MQEEHRYEDAFLSPTEFRWQSQNRTARDTAMGRKIQNHQAEATKIHLFVRAAAKVSGRTQPFAYAGALEFQRWDGDKPITVWWRLPSAIPIGLRRELHVPQA